jgi:hypothetical protein
MVMNDNDALMVGSPGTPATPLQKKPTTLQLARFKPNFVSSARKLEKAWNADNNDCFLVG